MAGSDYQYLIELYKRDSDNLLCQSLVKPDWLPANEAVRFKSFQAGWPAIEDERIVPLWRHGPDQPHISGVRAIATAADGSDIAVDIPLHYFLPYAQDVAQTLVVSGALAEGEQFLYSVNAYPVNGPTESEMGSRAFTVERHTASPVNGQRRIIDFSVLIEGEKGAGDAPFPVFVRKHILAEAEDLKEKAGAMETGGILLGFLWQDPDSGVPFAEVTALVPARHTVSSSTKLTFTPRTWTDVRAAIGLRGRNESFLGWVHTHVARFWCTCDDSAKQVNCPFARDFFSQDDRLLHRTVFSAAQHVAIVLGDRYILPGGWETTYSAYGWRNGVIEPRPFHVMGEQSCRMEVTGE